jgi:prevent-host-death family protein
MRFWQIQEAKQRFSEVLRGAEAGDPQVVTRHGREVAVLIDIAAYRSFYGRSPDLMEYLMADPVADTDLEIERDDAEPRDVDLSA